MPKKKDWLGIMGIYYKSQSILLSPFLNSCLNEDGIQLLNRTSEIGHVSNVVTEDYRGAIKIYQKCTHITGFPNISAKFMYKNILKENWPTIERIYGLCNSLIMKSYKAVYYYRVS